MMYFTINKIMMWFLNIHQLTWWNFFCKELSDMEMVQLVKPNSNKNQVFISFKKLDSFYKITTDRCNVPIFL